MKLALGAIAMLTFLAVAIYATGEVLRRDQAVLQRGPELP